MYDYQISVTDSLRFFFSQVAVELVKDPNRGLGFSIAGGKGSTPAYEDVDEVTGPC